MYRWAPTQVAHRRGSEWDSFVDTQPIGVYSGYGAGLRQDLLRDSSTRQLCRRYEYIRELPSVPHLVPRGLFNLEKIRVTLS
jgi:hypothetical protein